MACRQLADTVYLHNAATIEAAAGRFAKTGFDVLCFQSSFQKNSTALNASCSDLDLRVNSAVKKHAGQAI